MLWPILRRSLLLELSLACAPWPGSLFSPWPHPDEVRAKVGIEGTAYRFLLESPMIKFFASANGFVDSKNADILKGGESRLTQYAA